MEEFLIKYPELVYALTICACTFLILKYFISNPTKMQKFMVLIISGIVLGAITYFIADVRTPLMILAFFSSSGFYEIIIKLIMKKLGVSYNDEVKNNLDK